jgi:putative ABC transport system ATP-binding protein
MDDILMYNKWSVRKGMEILKTTDLTKYYSHNGTVTKAVDHVNINICKGEYVSIIGQSGAGKSTLLNLLGGLDKPDAGKVFIKGTSIYDEGKNLTVFRRRNIGFIFQSYNLMPFLNVWENIILPAGIDGKSLDKEFACELLERLELSAKKSSFPEELSGGQQQRVAIARALIMKPSIVLADEPTGNLDSKTGSKVFRLLLDVCKRFDQTLLLVTHNEMLAKEADTIIRVVDGAAVIEK